MGVHRYLLPLLFFMIAIYFRATEPVNRIENKIMPVERWAVHADAHFCPVAIVEYHGPSPFESPKTAIFPWQSDPPTLERCPEPLLMFLGLEFCVEFISGTLRTIGAL